MSDSLPNYYAILEVAPTVTEDQVKTAYKKAALKWRKTTRLNSNDTSLAIVANSVHPESERYPALLSLRLT